jgi:predicted anti-sigma-YlaC factor YlaD
MDCDRAREAISAGIDDEDPGLPGPDLEAHLASCASCRSWQQRAYPVTRRARLGGAFLDHDLAPRVLAAVPATGPRWRRQPVRRGALLILALAQLAIAVPMLLGRDHDAGVHAAHELGSFNLALACAFAAGVIRPKLSAGLAWPSGVAALGLAVTAIADLFSGQAIGADEAQHLVAVAGAALLAWQARTPDATGAGLAAMASPSAARPRLATAEAESRGQADMQPEPPGGHAARLTAPDVTAHASRPADTAPIARARSLDESVA